MCTNLIRSSGVHHILLFIIVCIGECFGHDSDIRDEQLFYQKIHLLKKNNVIQSSTRDIVLTVGKSFIGTQYASHTLESEQGEQLIVNLRAVDCVTFIEYCLAISRCAKLNKLNYKDFLNQIRYLRYRNGKLSDYASRLHYTIDYWSEAEKKGVLKIVTRNLFGTTIVSEIAKPIDFMTTNRSFYKPLSQDPRVFERMIYVERTLSSRSDFYLPIQFLKKHERKIQNGDLIGIVSHQKGMDISHVGIAIRIADSTLHLLHASKVRHKVEISELPLIEYLYQNNIHSGVVIARICN